MLAHPCPSCGQPAALDLSQPEILDCGACDVRSPLPAAIQERLIEGQRVLEALGVRDRQFTGLRRLLVSGGTAFIALYVLISIGVILPFILLMVPIMVVAFDPTNVTMSMGMSTGPVCGGLMMAFVSLLAVMRLVSLRRRLELAGAARPPERPGEPVRCHVCAAPVDAKGRVVRCGWCDADNVVHPKVLARVVEGEVQAIDQLEDHLEREARSITWAASGSALAGTGCTLLAPIGCGLPMSLALIIGIALLQVGAVMGFKFGPHPQNRYQVVETSQGPCLGWLNPYDDGERLLLEPPIEYSATPEILAPEELDGRRVLDRVSGEEGTIYYMTGGVFYTPEDMDPRQGPDLVRLKTADGREVHTDVPSICLLR